MADGSWGMSKPCNTCLKEIKKYEFKNAYYSIPAAFSSPRLIKERVYSMVGDHVCKGDKRNELNSYRGHNNVNSSISSFKKKQKRRNDSCGGNHRFSQK